MKSCLRIAKTKDELVITVSAEADFQEMLVTFKAKLFRIKKCYEKYGLPIHVTGKALKDSEQNAIRDILKNEVDTDIIFDDTGETLGLHAIKSTFEASVDTSETKFIRGSLRSGQHEEFSGSIAILGDLNYGAEVIAGENIIVTGIIRGVAHAGANGNRKAIISANAISSTQVRIANVVKEIEENDVKLPFIYLNGENIEIS